MSNIKKAPTIKDVARLSQVSLATVSRVINGIQGVSPELSERVHLAVKELGYYPNEAARSLVSKETRSIGVVVNNLHDPFFYDLLRGFEQGSYETDYNVVFCSVPSGASSKKAKYVQYLTNGVVDGLVLYGSYLSDKPLVHYLQNETTCDYIIIENNIPEVGCNELIVDNAKGVQQAITYFSELGHSKIAHICGDLNKMVSTERLNGYMRTMQSLGLEIAPSYIQNATADYRGGYDCMQALLQLKDRPTAVFCYDDAIASYAIRAALDAGLSIPGDMSVIGFDNQRILLDWYNGPAITSVEQPLFDIGKDSILLLTQRLQSGTQATPLRKMYPTDLIIKASTGLAPV